MGLILFLIYGLVVGAVAKWIVPGEGPGGILGDMVVGIIGAFIGGWLAITFFHVSYANWSLSGFVCSVLGAIVLLFILRAISGRRSAV
ncbi:MAG: GlsB/YeaQ/YmgE family stress response membrane protein [Vulcanimicrobiaceae bacterium]